MNYSNLVDQYIKDSGLSLGEIARRMLEEKGIKIDRSYISKLRKNPKYPASEDINRALAIITGHDPEELVKAAYYETAPDEVKKIMESTASLKSSVNQVSQIVEKLNQKKQKSNNDFDAYDHLNAVDIEKLLEFYGNIDVATALFKDLTNDSLRSYELKQIRERKKLSTLEMSLLLNMPEDNYILLETLGETVFDKYYNDLLFLLRPITIVPVIDSIRKIYPPDFTVNENNYAYVNPSLVPGEGFPLEIKDDNMSGDRIFTGDIAIVSEDLEIKASDIAVVLIKGREACLKRVIKHDDYYMLTCSNAAIEPIIIPKDQVEIIGKVVEVIFRTK